VKALRRTLARFVGVMTYGPFLLYLAFKWLEVLLDPEDSDAES
jgi:hypothetical protein